ncbi:MAG: tRNA (adenosine(37)-N6)-threonylcarbamoyltransferase complex transferase subunit TsaD, partial [Hyphomicrobiaceae bacterium]|nr:tRNA (adenosine(37)-N6)-threonylcarbamoyltransferase complex transferase subunit TsaD [Hyphomicrobiaceae bacterium]
MGLRPSTVTGQSPHMVLGLESSCDETAAAIVVRHADGRGEVLSNVVRSQIDEHRAYGGVVPELAAR